MLAGSCEVATVTPCTVPPPLMEAAIMLQEKVKTTEDQGKILEEQCLGEARQRGPPRQSPVPFMQCPAHQDRLESCWWNSTQVNSSALQAVQGHWP
jgi:hypothetical protein